LKKPPSPVPFLPSLPALTLLALALTLAASFAAPASADSSIFDMEPPASVFRGQPPVSAADIPLGVAMYAYLGTNPSGYDTDAYELAGLLGYTPERAAFVLARFRIGIRYIIMNTEDTVDEARSSIARRFGTPLAVPSDEEIQYIDRGWKAVRMLFPPLG
jgi:hypothetical protein